MDDVTNKLWDVVIVGTGMGGATLGFSLAKQGKSVLFCEQGLSFLSGNKALTGTFAELTPEYKQAQTKKDREDILARAGRFNCEIEDWSEGRPQSFIPFIGSGIGGSSALYGGTLDRFSPSDFDTKTRFGIQGESSRPDSWPISYDDMRPYYKQAESLYEVAGEKDPLRADVTDELLPYAPLTPLAQKIKDFLRERGLHPYRVPSAHFKENQNCSGCQSFICAFHEKNDSVRMCLKPALEKYGAKLLDQCKVISVRAEKKQAHEIMCEREGKQFSLKAKVFVLAAGALGTPGILLRSKSSDWKQGLGNDFDLVGRNMMRHLSDVLVLRVGEKNVANMKEVGFNDFNTDAIGLGVTVKSWSNFIPPQMIADDFDNFLSRTRLTFLIPVYALIKPFVIYVLKKFFDKTYIMGSVMEDLPYAHNRVFLTDTGRTAFVYKLGESEKKRIALFRQKIKELFKPFKIKLIKSAEDNRHISHICGTCRFGTDPKTSVLDASNRIHGMNNLFVVDSSFFPTSSGTNPALTIAANALRVGDLMLQDKKLFQ